MTVSPELLQQVRDLGRQRSQQRLTNQVARARRALAGIVDTGPLSDDDVLQLVASYQAGQAEANGGLARPV